MRLAYLVGSWPSPSETFLAREVAGLRAAGLELEVVAFHPGPGGPAPGVTYRHELLAEAGRRALADALPALAPTLAGACPTRPALTARWLANLPFAAALARWCRRRGCDLLHAAWAGLPAQVAWAAHRLGGPRYTVAGHAHDVFCAPEESPAALAEAAGVCVCNRTAEQALRRRAPGLGDRLAYLPHGLPLADWPRRDEPIGEPVVIGVGRLVPKKGWDTLVAAAAGLAVPLELVGDGPERDALARQAADLGVRLRLRGWVPPAAVREALARATALALPSRRDPAGDRDGVANVLLEALAVGVPVVTTAAGSAADVIVAGETGLLVPPDQPAALRSALARLLADAGLRARLAEAGRVAVERRFDGRVTETKRAHWLRAAAGR